MCPSAFFYLQFPPKQASFAPNSSNFLIQTQRRERSTKMEGTRGGGSAASEMTSTPFFLALREQTDRVNASLEALQHLLLLGAASSTSTATANCPTKLPTRQLSSSGSDLEPGQDDEAVLPMPSQISSVSSTAGGNSSQTVRFDFILNLSASMYLFNH